MRLLLGTFLLPVGERFEYYKMRDYTLVRCTTEMPDRHTRGVESIIAPEKNSPKPERTKVLLDPMRLQYAYCSPKILPALPFPR